MVSINVLKGLIDNCMETMLNDKVDNMVKTYKSRKAEIKTYLYIRPQYARINVYQDNCKILGASLNCDTLDTQTYGDGSDALNYIVTRLHDVYLLCRADVIEFRMPKPSKIVLGEVRGSTKKLIKLMKAMSKITMNLSYPNMFGRKRDWQGIAHTELDELALGYIDARVFSHKPSIWKTVFEHCHPEGMRPFSAWTPSKDHIHMDTSSSILIVDSYEPYRRVLPTTTNEMNVKTQPLYITTTL